MMTHDPLIKIGNYVTDLGGRAIKCNVNFLFIIEIVCNCKKTKDEYCIFWLINNFLQISLLLHTHVYSKTHGFDTTNQSY